jgi:hypothetical protein
VSSEIIALTSRSVRRLFAVPSYGALVGLVLGLNLVSNAVDLTTSYVALGQGLHEANALALGIAAVSKLPVLNSLVILKAFFISGAVTTAFAGLRSKDPGTKTLLLRSIAISTLFFFAISLNNFLWIFHLA